MSRDILVWADPHIALHNEFSKQTDDGLTSYLQDVKASFAWLCRVILDTRPIAVICLGDVWDSTGLLDTRSLVVGYGCLVDVHAACLKAGAGIPHYVVGNHDVYDEHNEIHNLKVLSEIGVVHSRPEVVTISDGVTVGFLPWCSVEDAEVFLAGPGNVSLFSHMPIRGSTFFKTRSGYHQFEVDGIPVESFRCPHVFNGHYHNPSDLSTDSTVVHNVGAFLARSFHDVGSLPRGISLVPASALVNRHSGPPASIANPHSMLFIDHTSGDPIPPHAESMNARVYLRAGESREAAVEAAASFANARIVESPPEESSVRDERVSAAKSPGENLLTYVEAHGPREMMDDLTEIAGILSQTTSVRHAPKFVHMSSIRISNYRSAADVQIKYTPGLTLVHGRNEDDQTATSNGAGKTTVLIDALHWCLTGESTRKSSVSDVVRDGEKGCLVEASFSMGGSAYAVTRTRNHPEYGTGVTIFKDGEEITVRRAKDNDEKLRDILGGSVDYILQTMLLSNDAKSRFTELTSSQRMQALEHLTGMEIYEDIKDRAGALLSAATLEHSKARDASSKAEAEVTGIRSALEAVEETLARMEADSVAAISSAKSRVSAAISRLEEATSSIAEADGEEQALLSKTEEVAVATKDAEIAVTSRRHRIAQLESSVKRISSRVREIDGLTARCVVCEHDLSDEHRASLRVDSTSALQAETAELSREKALLTSELEKLSAAQGEQRGLASSLADCRRRSAGLASSKAAYLRDITSGKEELARLAKLGAGTAEARDRHKRALDEAVLRADRAAVDEQTAEAAKAPYQWWATAMSPGGIRSYLMDAVIQRINGSLVDYSQDLLGPSMGVVQVSPTKEKVGGVSNKIDIVLSGSRSLSQLSSGQRRRVDLLIQLALTDMAAEYSGSGSNVLVCDEVLDPIDEHGCRGFVDVLRGRAARTSIFVSSHNSYLKSLAFDRTWTVTLKDGKSTISKGVA